MQEPDPQPEPAADEKTRKARTWPSLVLIHDLVGWTGTLIWIFVTFWLDFPLVFFPFLTAAAMGWTLQKMSGGGVQKGLMIYSGTVAFLLGILGNSLTTILLGSSGEETSTSLQDLFEFLQVRGQLVSVIQETLTPMDLLIYSFIPLLAGMLAKGSFFGQEDDTPIAEHLPVGTAIPLGLKKDLEEDDDLPAS